MAVTVKNIIPAKEAESSQTTQYTATNCRCIIDKFTATNTSAGSESLSVNLVAASGTAGNDNLIVDARMLAAGETYTFPELVGQVLDTSSFISTIASAATSLTITASGREIVA
jgi:hypothetical protein